MEGPVGRPESEEEHGASEKKEKCSVGFEQKGRKQDPCVSRCCPSLEEV